MTVTIETKSGLFELAPVDGESILFSGLADGLTLPYECATGTCGTCRARVMSGTVDVRWDAAPGFAKLKRDKGDVLMCQSRANGACVVRVPSDVRRLEAGDGATLPRRVSANVGGSRLLTHDVVEFEVTLAAPMTFEAGQFVVLEAEGVTGGRAYSMVNDAGATDRLVFAVKRKPGGGFSEWLFAGGIGGAPLSVFGPLGRATFAPSEAHDLVVVAGGSGIAGMMSILARATAASHFARHRGRVFFGVRTLADGFYLGPLSEFVAAAGGALEVTLVLSHEIPPGDTHPDYPSIRLAGGFVHEAAGQALAGGAEGALGFVAGPPPMVDGAIRVLLTAARIPSRMIRFDKFG